MTIPANNEQPCNKCGALGTNLNTDFCLICLVNRGEREREIDRVTSYPVRDYIIQ